MIKHYYKLVKPGIVYGNTIIATAGFLLASQGHVQLGLLFSTLVGLALVIASGCVVNNYFDRDMDAKMERTKNRALVTGDIAVKNAFMYAALLGVVGFALLIVYTNLLTVLIALAGCVIYLVLYTPLKRVSMYAALVGSASGAVPPLVGYTAVTGHLDMAAFILFCMLVLWQMPHFYAIAIYRWNDYVAANIPLLPIKKGIAFAKASILVYIAAFIFTASMLTILDYTGRIYLTVVLFFGLQWFLLGVKGFVINDDKKWSRKMFRLSLLVLMLTFVTIILEILFK